MRSQATGYFEVRLILLLSNLSIAYVKLLLFVIVRYTELKQGIIK